MNLQETDNIKPYLNMDLEKNFNDVLFIYLEFHIRELK